MLDIHVVNKAISLAYDTCYIRSVGPFRIQITSQVQGILEEWYYCRFRSKRNTTETYEHGFGVRNR